MPSLFEPIELGNIYAKNRILMAPLTRARGTREHVPTSIMVEYYAQRAGAGLIISEATGISREGLGWPYAPGLWSQEQVEAWKPITAAVHSKGGKIVAQLWHMGRMVHSSVTGQKPVSCSATKVTESLYTYDEKQASEIARPLAKEDIARILNDYENAAHNALMAGFDGVQIHAANGYLIDEFLRDGTNHRFDEYGGSPENCIRFLHEVTERVIAAIGADKTSVRLSPNGKTEGCIDSNPEQVFVPAAKLLNDLDIAFLELRELQPNATSDKIDQPKLHGPIREVFRHPLVLNLGYTRDKAIETIATGVADAISFGRLFLANPDLVRRLEDNLSLNEDDIHTWYSQGAEGYTDYPLAR